MARLLEASQHNSPNGPETPGRRFDIQSDLPELLAAFYFECFTTLTFLLCLLLCLALLLMNIHTGLAEHRAGGYSDLRKGGSDGRSEAVSLTPSV